MHHPALWFDPAEKPIDRLIQNTPDSKFKEMKLYEKAAFGCLQVHRQNLRGHCYNLRLLLHRMQIMPRGGLRPHLYERRLPNAMKKLISYLLDAIVLTAEHFYNLKY